MANRDATSIYNEANGRVVEIEAERERLNREEEGIKSHRDEKLNNIRDSIERNIFTAMRGAKDALPDIGLPD
jgi:sensor domain CHASE-containing protein